MPRVALVLLQTIILTASMTVQANPADDSLRILMTVGGVRYNTSIVRLLRSNPDIQLTVRDVDNDGVVFTDDVLSNTDAVLMYHRDNNAEAEERRALLNYLANGGGVVVLHHSIANYPDWSEWWRDHVGGLYAFPGQEGLTPSTYFYGFSGVARPTIAHPITNRLGGAWRYADESYDELWIADNVEVLLSTTAFGSEPRLAWIGPSTSQRVIYIQPGHSEEVMLDAKYPHAHRGRAALDSAIRGAVLAAISQNRTFSIIALDLGYYRAPSRAAINKNDSPGELL